ncbi:hypothetical protein AB2N08_20430 [Massilia aurea]|uniref:hypothetical protein n=1 Tax=Massilia aurea TaxID=373040 RepID=UPI003462EEB6
MAQVILTLRTHVPVSTGEAWAWSTSLDGVRTEMRPLLKVVFPRSMTHIRPDTARNTVLGRCQFLLFGLFPIDMSRLRFTEMEPGHRFVEESDLLSMHSWRHERVITPSTDGRGARVTDHLAFTPRLATPLVRYLVKLFFARRHKKLARALGERAAAAGRRAADRGEAGRAR